MVLLPALRMEEKQDRLPQMGAPCTVEQQVPGATKGEEIRSCHFTEDPGSKRVSLRPLKE